MSMFDEEAGNQLHNGSKNQFMTPKRVEMSIEWTDSSPSTFQRIVLGTEHYSNALVDFLLKELSQGSGQLFGNIVGKEEDSKKATYGTIWGSQSAGQSIGFIKLEKSFFGYERILNVLKQLFTSSTQQTVILHFLPRPGVNALHRISSGEPGVLTSVALLPVGEIVNHHFTASLLNFSQGRSFQTHALVGIANPDNFTAFAELLENSLQQTRAFLSLESAKALRADKESMDHIRSIVFASASPLYL